MINIFLHVFVFFILYNIELNMSKKLDETLSLHVPPWEEIANTLRTGLQENFENVTIAIVDCPDLTQAPFYLAAKGLGGTAKIVDVGGPGYLFPTVRKDKVYNLSEVCETSKLPNAFVLGAGAGPTHMLGFNSEMVHNCHFDNGSLISKSHIIYINQSGSKPYTVKMLDNQTANEFTLMSNLILTEGTPGKVLKVEASKRIGQENFITCMRLALAKQYGTNPVGLGGFFIIKNGKAKMHIMPELPEHPFTGWPDVDKWLKYFEQDAPLVCASVFVSHDPGLDLRVEHSHCFSGDKVNGGHYHYDTSPDEINYEGYFVPAQLLYRIDRP